MESMTMVREIRGGFKAEREFGFALATRFPGLNLTGLDIEGAALVVEIDNPRHLNLFQLSKVLIGAAKGGVKTAVIDVKGKQLTAAIPLFTFFALVDENVTLKEMRRLERLIKARI
ncbi:hypothetical protein ACFV0H_28585 [Streptomyces erythrochromogenes]|uniref:hypothetical protein n=1 Tax=Streptomyces erythrochromogenes TaxID=285574 RepID=UPI00368835DA